MCLSLGIRIRIKVQRNSIKDKVWDRARKNFLSQPRQSYMCDILLRVIHLSPQNVNWQLIGRNHFAQLSFNFELWTLNSVCVCCQTKRILFCLLTYLHLLLLLRTLVYVERVCSVFSTWCWLLFIIIIIIVIYVQINLLRWRNYWPHRPRNGVGAWVWRAQNYGVYFFSTAKTGNLTSPYAVSGAPKCFKIRFWLGSHGSYCQRKSGKVRGKLEDQKIR